MRINKGQRNLDGLDLATLQALLTAVNQAMTNRMSGNGVATQATKEIVFGGLVLKAETLDDLLDICSDLANAIQKKDCGSTFTVADLGGGDCGPNGGIGASLLR